MCGDSWRNNIFTIDSFGTADTPCANPPCEIEIHYTYRGCYVDSSDQRDIGTLRAMYTKYLYVEFACTFTCVCVVRSRYWNWQR